jgi:hypothetical protein
MALCNYSQSNYTPPHSYGTRNLQADRYVKMSNYGTGYTFKTGYILNDIQPNTYVKKDYCKTNNLCQNTKTYTYLNKRGVESSPFFEKSSECGYKSTIPDARLYDTSRNYNMHLDITPIQVPYDVKHDTIDGMGESYGRNYKSYETVNAGQIQYYVDKEIAQPFFSPVYAMPSETHAIVYTDPMGTKKPQFTKKFNNDRLQHTNTLSWLEDTTKHREDIMSLQQRTNNEKRYDLMYGKM